MKLAIFGGTGGTGQQLVRQALDAGHSVRMLARTPEKNDVQHEDLTVIKGNILDPAQVAETIQGADVVLSSLGSSQDNPEKIISTGTQNIVQEMKKQGVRRLVVVTSLGVGDSKDQVPLAFKIAIKTVPILKKAMLDMEVVERIVRASDLDWTIVRPGGLRDAPRTGQYTFGVESSISARQVSRADVADFMLRQVTDDTFIRQAPAVT